MPKTIHRLRYMPAPSHKNHQFFVPDPTTGRAVRVIPNAEFHCDPIANARLLDRVRARVPGLRGADGKPTASIFDLGPLNPPTPVRMAPPPTAAALAAAMPAPLVPPTAAEVGAATAALTAPAPAAAPAPAVDPQRDPLEPPKPYEAKPLHVAFAKSLGLEVDGMKKDAIVELYTAELKRRAGGGDEPQAPTPAAPQAPAPTPTPAAPQPQPAEQPAPTTEAPTEG